MGTFADDRAAMDEAYATGMDRIAVELDGKAPTARPTPATPAAPAAKPAEDTGPGFFSRLWSGLSSAAGKASDLAENVASRVEVRSISGARSNAIASLPPPRPEAPWGLIIGGAAALAVLVAALTRRS